MEGGAADQRRKGETAAATGAAKHDKEEEEEEEWLMLNDFLVEKTVLDDARGFGPDWKEPCVLVYRRVPSALEEEARAAEDQARRAVMGRKRLSITPSVFDIAPVSKVLQRVVRWWWWWWSSSSSSCPAPFDGFGPRALKKLCWAWMR